MNGLERSTAEVRRIDLSASQDRASIASEADLFHGYSRVTSGLVTLPCACGGNVTADPDAPARGVAAHQFTGRHKAWRSANDL